MKSLNYGPIQTFKFKIMVEICKDRMWLLGEQSTHHFNGVEILKVVLITLRNVMNKQRPPKQPIITTFIIYILKISNDSLLKMELLNTLRKSKVLKKDALAFVNIHLSIYLHMTDLLIKEYILKNVLNPPLSRLTLMQKPTSCFIGD